jgi:hypothetical protein
LAERGDGRGYEIEHTERAKIRESVAINSMEPDR